MLGTSYVIFGKNALIVLVRFRKLISRTAENERQTKVG